LGSSASRRLNLITFATPQFAAARDGLVASALETGELRRMCWDVARLRNDSGLKAQELLAHPKGGRLLVV